MVLVLIPHIKTSYRDNIRHDEHLGHMKYDNFALHTYKSESKDQSIVCLLWWMASFKLFVSVLHQFNCFLFELFAGFTDRIWIRQRYLRYNSTSTFQIYWRQYLNCATWGILYSRQTVSPQKPQDEVKVPVTKASDA